ncbi:MAG: hypothetical protein AAFN51_03365 [Pseudomonadota bacterium]
MSAKIISLPFADRVEKREVDGQDTSQSQELRRARIRIAQLEASLSEAMRDSLVNFNRARDAERSLAELKSVNAAR